MTKWWALLWACMFTWVAATAFAGNDDSILLGNDAALTGGAVVATANDGTALWYNPAGLAGARHDSVDVGASAFALRRYKIPALLEAADGTRANASFTEIVSIPSALSFVRRVHPRAVVGLALFASQVYDFTLRSSFVVDDRFNDLRFQAQTMSTAEIARYHLAGGVGFTLPRGFSAGIALFGDYADSTESQRQSADAALGGQLLLFAVDSLHVQQKVLGFHLRAGLSYRPTSTVTLGLSLESPGVYFYRSTRLTQVQSETNLAAAIDESGPVLTSSSVDRSESHVELGLYAPVRVRFGGALLLGRATVALEGDLQHRLRDAALAVDRERVWNLRAGVRVPVSERLNLGGGFFTDRSADRADRLGAGKIDFYGATLGGEYANVRWLAGEGVAETKRSTITFSSTLALRYAYGHGKALGSQLAMPSYEVREVATDIDVHELTLHIGSGLYF